MAHDSACFDGLSKCVMTPTSAVRTEDSAMIHFSLSENTLVNMTVVRLPGSSSDFGLPYLQTNLLQEKSETCLLALLENRLALCFFAEHSNGPCARFTTGEPCGIQKWYQGEPCPHHIARSAKEELSATS